MPLGIAVATYLVMGVPPFEVGFVQLTKAESVPGFAVTVFGAEGGAGLRESAEAEVTFVREVALARPRARIKVTL